MTVRASSTHASTRSRARAAACAAHVERAKLAKVGGNPLPNARRPSNPYCGGTVPPFAAGDTFSLNTLNITANSISTVDFTSSACAPKR